MQCTYYIASGLVTVLAMTFLPFMEMGLSVETLQGHVMQFFSFNCWVSTIRLLNASCLGLTSLLLMLDLVCFTKLISDESLLVVVSSPVVYLGLVRRQCLDQTSSQF